MSSPYASIPMLGTTQDTLLAAVRALIQNVNLLVQNAGAPTTSSSVFAKTTDIIQLQTRITNLTVTSGGGTSESIVAALPVGSANFNAGSIVLTGSDPQAIVTARLGRISVMIANIGTDTIWIVNSVSGVASNAYPLRAGSAETFTTQAAVYGIPNSGTLTATFLELW